MFGFNRFALRSPEGDESGSGAAGGESSGEGGSGEKPKDEVVPKSQFIAALNNAEQKRERELAALRAEFEAKLAAATAKPVETPKRYTRAELNAAVRDERITQDQADEVWEQQIREDAAADARKVATETVQQAQRRETVDSQIAQYTALKPEILDNDSETRQKIRDEFQFLVNLGDPKNVATELKAIRAVLGPIETLRAAASGKASHESHRETGGSGGGGSPKGGTGKLVDSLTPREKQHYQKQIDNGLYKGWSAVEEELQYARPEIRRKHGQRCDR